MNKLQLLQGNKCYLSKEDFPQQNEAKHMIVNTLCTFRLLRHDETTSCDVTIIKCVR